MLRLRLLLLIISAGWLAFASAWAAPSRIERYSIADEQGDFGLPTPYTHASGGMGYVLTSLVFDTLVWRDASGTLVPALASAWRQSADHRAVEFTLRPDARWHDGKPVRAADVAFTFDYLRQHPHPLFDLGAVDGVDDLGKGRVRVRLKRVYAPFLAQLAGAVPILPQHVYARLADPQHLKLADIVGSGPYRLSAYDKAAGRYLFAANEHYYLGVPRVRSLAFLRMQPSLAVGALKRGQVDMIRSLPSPLAAEVATFATLVSAPSGHPVRLRFNHARPPFDDKHLRQAIARGIDRQELLRVVENGQGEVSAGRFMRASAWQTGAPLAAYAFDAAAARRALAGLGHGAGADGRLRDASGQPWVVELAAARSLARPASVLAGQLEKLGLEVNVRIIDSGILAARIGAAAFDLALVSQGTLGDPESMLRQTAGNGPFSDAFRRSDLLELLQQQVGSMDTARRRALLDRAQAIYADELPAFFLYAPRWSTAANARLRPWYTPEGIAVGISLPLNKLMFVN
ncbi:ABC transporter substrate-binding protein [Janthinobacterium sp. RB2P8]|uniref:ABC transporter substrate-binding protein n=1 Tax=Janthinobacterium sp. RB2P8 TaxID=3424191 RepID=UPI003F22F89F